MLLNFFEQKRSSIGNPFIEVEWLTTLAGGSAGGGDAGKRKSQSIKGIAAGGITGAIEICITYPTEYVKTQLQLDGKGGAKQYTGVGDIIKKTVKQYGIFGLYRGLSILLYGAVPKVASRFGAYEALKNLTVGDHGKLSPFGSFMCGLGAGTIEALVAVTPMETIKVKFINDRRSEKPRFKGFLHGVALIIKEEGFRGIYQGPFPTVLRQGSNAALRFFFMETFKDLYRGGDPTVYVTKPAVALMGAFAGAFAAVGNAPIDVVKTRMQSLEAKKYKGSIDCFMRMFKEEGVMSFFKGIGPRLVRVCMDCAITFSVYDSIMEIFNEKWP